LERIVRVVERARDTTVLPELQKVIQKTNRKVAKDAERFKFNTAIAALMIALNELETHADVPLSITRDYIILLSPFAPHLAEHLWEKMGGEGSVHSASWPKSEVVSTEGELLTIVVQVNGKRRGTIDVRVDT